MTGLFGWSKLVAAPESSIIALVGLPARRKAAIFGIVYAAYLAVGMVFISPETAVPLRLFGLFVPLLAVLLWGGVAALAIYLATLPGVYALLTLRGADFVGGAAGPIYASLTLLLVGGLRHYIVRLDRARQEISTLEGILPICATCKKIRDDSGYWQQVERYLSDRTPAQFTHGICPDCRRAAMAEIA